MARYYRLSGGGNDFIALPEPGELPAAERIRAWCTRGTSLGADGLFALDRSATGVRMIHFNADGGRSELCLNGTRCAARLAFHLGWADREIAIATDSGEIAARALADGRIELELPPLAGRPDASEAPEEMSLEVDGQAYAGFRIVVGVPHFVIEWPRSLADAPVERLGAALRSHPTLGAPGANVDFVRYPAPGRLEIRTFERGVEAETLACGSGVLAAAAAGVAAKRCEPPLEALTGGGFVLGVAAAPTAGGTLAWRLSGDARLIAEGVTHEGAEALPDPPRWSA